MLFQPNHLWIVVYTVKGRFVRIMRKITRESREFTDSSIWQVRVQPYKYSKVTCTIPCVGSWPVQNTKWVLTNIPQQWVGISMELYINPNACPLPVQWLQYNRASLCQKTASRPSFLPSRPKPTMTLLLEVQARIRKISLVSTFFSTFGHPLRLQ